MRKYKRCFSCIAKFDKYAVISVYVCMNKINSPSFILRITRGQDSLCRNAPVSSTFNYVMEI